MAYSFNKIIFDLRWIKQGEHHRLVYEVTDQGKVNSLSRKFNDFHSSRRKHEKNLCRGELFKIFECVSSFYQNGMHPGSYIPDDAIENDTSIMDVYLFQGDNPLGSFSKNGGILEPQITSFDSTLFFRGESIRSLLYSPERVDDEIWFGSDFIETYFDVKIPNGFEGLALTEVRNALSHADGELLEEGKDFLLWLIQGTGLPKMSDKLIEFFEHNTGAFREYWDYLKMQNDIESALLHGAAFLYSLQLDKMAKEYLKTAAKEGCVGALRLLTSHLFEAGDADEAFKYAIIGVGAGVGECCYIAATIAALRGDKNAAMAYVDRGIELKNGQSFALKARLWQKQEYDEFAPRDNDYRLDKIRSFAEFSAELGCPEGMLTYAQILLEYYEADEKAVQWLRRASDLGEKRALIVLAEYFREDHDGPYKKDLALAQTYAKQAILEEAGNLEGVQLLYADILLEAGKADAKLVDQLIGELAVKGNKKAMIMIGKMVTGCDARCPELIYDVISPELEQGLKNPNEFFMAASWRYGNGMMPAAEAAKRLGKLANESEPLAFYELAKIYREGPSDMVDEKKAAYFEECFEKYKNGSSVNCGRKKQK